MAYDDTGDAYAGSDTLMLTPSRPAGNDTLIGSSAACAAGSSAIVICRSDSTPCAGLATSTSSTLAGQDGAPASAAGGMNTIACSAAGRGVLRVLLLPPQPALRQAPPHKRVHLLHHRLAASPTPPPDDRARFCGERASRRTAHERLDDHAADCTAPPPAHPLTRAYMRRSAVQTTRSCAGARHRAPRAGARRGPQIVSATPPRSTTLTQLPAPPPPLTIPMPRAPIIPAHVPASAQHEKKCSRPVGQPSRSAGGALGRACACADGVAYADADGAAYSGAVSMGQARGTQTGAGGASAWCGTEAYTEEYAGGTKENDGTEAVGCRIGRTSAGARRAQRRGWQAAREEAPAARQPAVTVYGSVSGRAWVVRLRWRGREEYEQGPCRMQTVGEVYRARRVPGVSAHSTPPARRGVPYRRDAARGEVVDVHCVGRAAVKDEVSTESRRGKTGREGRKEGEEGVTGEERIRARMTPEDPGHDDAHDHTPDTQRKRVAGKMGGEEPVHNLRGNDEHPASGAFASSKAGLSFDDDEGKRSRGQGASPRRQRLVKTDDAGARRAALRAEIHKSAMLRIKMPRPHQKAREPRSGVRCDGATGSVRPLIRCAPDAHGANHRRRMKRVRCANNENNDEAGYMGELDLVRSILQWQDGSKNSQNSTARDMRDGLLGRATLRRCQRSQEAPGDPQENWIIARLQEFWQIYSGLHFREVESVGRARPELARYQQTI
ncbi:hypothetical protein C8J57DRAFT_1599597 [Mycena rebaudengoi]|nr:hypothetical protein C8J57DRAFT_1599597 [Mycena rebaudengoi]